MRARIRGRSKYRAIPTRVDGVRFASKAEASRFVELKLLEKAGKIQDLELQPSFQIEVNGHRVCVYKADFAYRDGATWERVIEDVKGMRTPVYRLKKKLVEAQYGVTITEVTK
jgi:hypothetical protein